MRQQVGGRPIPNLSPRCIQLHVLGFGRWRRPIAGPMVPRASRSRTDFAENFTFGHLHAGPNEGILFFDREWTLVQHIILCESLLTHYAPDIFPIKLQWLLRTPWHAERSLSQLMKRFNSPSVAAADPANMIKRSMPPDLPLTVTEIVPRLKDGGAFVKFSYPAESSIESIEKSLHQYLREHPIKPWFSPFRRMKAYLVRGRPWLEDLYRLPSSRLKVEFVPGSPSGSAVELSQEALYSLFRRYGKLADIKPQPADSKVLPRYAFLDFASLRPAIVARNCMHGFRVPEEAGGGSTGTDLRLTYEQKIKAHWIRDWLFNHPRLVIPALAVIITTITVAVFDPSVLRQLFWSVYS